MNIKTVRELLRSELKKQGLERFRVARQPESWGWPEMDVSPFFAPDVLRKSFGIQILGGVGVHIRDFEKQWIVMLKRHDPSKKIGNGFLFGRHLSNFKQFIPPRTIEQENDIQAELETVLQLMNELPENIENLVADLLRGLVGPHQVRGMLGHKVKWLAFLKWLRENSYDVPTKLNDLHPSQLIEPYGAIYQELTA